MVRSLEMSEIPRRFLNEQMHCLADEAFLDHDDPILAASWSQYIRLATAFVVDALKLNDKVILEVIVFHSLSLLPYLFDSSIICYQNFFIY